MTKRRVSTLFVLSLIASAAVTTPGVQAAENEDAVRLFNGTSLDGWTLKGPPDASKWTVGLAKLDPDNNRQVVVSPAAEGEGELINAAAHGLDLYTKQKFGDAIISLEFMVPRGSNSGIYIMGEYEIQILDSFGRQTMTTGDCGGLYSFSAPRVNAAKPPGQWQRIVIEFQAPRFVDGKKTANARLIKATLNGRVIHEDVEITNQTPGGVTGHEAPTGPLMFQGNHGVVAFRNIEITPLE